MSSGSSSSSVASLSADIDQAGGSEGGQGGYSSHGEEEVDWKERCDVLEASLHRFKQQASRIRELLAVKVGIKRGETNKNCFY